MKNLLICAGFMAMVLTGETLTCNSCRVGFKGRCLFPSTETCNDPESGCYRGNLVFNITKLMGLHTRGCLPLALCNQTEKGTLLTAGYTVTRDCCNTDNCNAAASVQLTLTAALGAAVAAVWFQLSF